MCGICAARWQPETLRVVAVCWRFMSQAEVNSANAASQARILPGAIHGGERLDGALQRVCTRQCGR